MIEHTAYTRHVSIAYHTTYSMLYIPGYVLQTCGTNDTGIQKHALIAAYFMFGGTRDASCVPHDIEVSRDTSTVHHCGMRGGGVLTLESVTEIPRTYMRHPTYIVSYKRPNKKLNICYNFARHTLYDTAYRNDPITRSDKQYSTSTENSELRAASAQYTLTFVLAYYVLLFTVYVPTTRYCTRCTNKGASFCHVNTRYIKYIQVYY